MRYTRVWGTLLAGLLAWGCLGAAEPVEVKVTVPDEPADMKPLIGADLSNWVGNMDLWSLKDGVIRGETTKEKPTQGNTFLVWGGDEQGREVEDFELRLSVRIHHGNSGVQYRSELLPAKPDAVNQWVVKGYQMEVENTPGKAGFLYHERGRGWICNVGDKVVMNEQGKPEVVGSLGGKDAVGKTYRKATVEAEAPWNDYVIIARGNHLQQWVNGYQTVDVIDNDPKNRHMKGIIALQIHAGPPMWVEFKDLRLKRLTAE